MNNLVHSKQPDLSTAYFRNKVKAPPANECWTAAWQWQSCLWITFIISHHHWLKRGHMSPRILICYSDHVRKIIKMRRHWLKLTDLVSVTKWLTYCILWHMIITFFRCHWITYYWAISEKNTLVIRTIRVLLCNMILNTKGWIYGTTSWLQETNTHINYKLVFFLS